MQSCHILTTHGHIIQIYKYQNYRRSKMQKLYLDNIVQHNIQIIFGVRRKWTKDHRLYSIQFNSIKK